MVVDKLPPVTPDREYVRISVLGEGLTERLTVHEEVSVSYRTLRSAGVHETVTADTALMVNASPAMATYLATSVPPMVYVMVADPAAPAVNVADFIAPVPAAQLSELPLLMLPPVQVTVNVKPWSAGRTGVKSICTACPAEIMAGSADFVIVD